MASYVPGTVISGLTADGDLSAKQYHIVEKGTTAGQVSVCNSAGDVPYGVLQNKPTSGQAAAVMLDGTTKLVAGGAISVGDAVGTKSDGRGVTKTANNDHMIGRAKTASAADGDVIEVMLHIGQVGA